VIKTARTKATRVLTIMKDPSVLFLIITVKPVVPFPERNDFSLLFLLFSF
jgi:hypothetical protein